MDHIVSVDWLKEHSENENVYIADCRFQLASPEAGYAAYKRLHIPGAHYFDLEKDLSGSKTEHGGRHPLPSLEQISEVFGRGGIAADSKVVCYDDGEGEMAARMWWLLKYTGHDQAAVLDGGIRAWERAGYPLTDEIPETPTAEYKPVQLDSWLSDVTEVKEKLHDQSGILIDSRAPGRYKGENEPIDKAAGHIPGAVNYFWKDNLENGRFKHAEALDNRFADLDKKAEITVYCGSGVTACVNFLALKESGFKNVKLYAGSWSDWISYPGNPIEKDD